MEPSEVEFLAENTTVSIVTNFSENRLTLLTVSRRELKTHTGILIYLVLRHTHLYIACSWFGRSVVDCMHGSVYTNTKAAGWLVLCKGRVYCSVAVGTNCLELACIHVRLGALTV